MGASQSSTRESGWGWDLTNTNAKVVSPPPASKVKRCHHGNDWYRLSDNSWVLDNSGDDLRVSFDTTIGASVKGFPSKGGVYERHCSPMELDYLNLSRLETVERSPDQEEEDAFCARLLLLGADWWTSMDAKHEYENSKDPRHFSYHYQPEGFERPLRDPRKVHYFAITSEGGIWVLGVDKKCEGRKKGVGRIENAANMEEKCREIEKFGGEFFANPRDCPSLDFRGIDGVPASDEFELQMLRFAMEERDHEANERS